MPTQTTEHIVDAQGKLKRRVITEAEIVIQDDIIAQFVANTTVKCPDFHHWDLGQLHLATRGGIVFTTLWIPYLTMRAPFRLANKLMVPQFQSREDPIMTLKWEPPDDMRLCFCMSVTLPTGVDQGFGCNYHYLFATDKAKAAYRLPLPNLYDDCRICMGTDSPITGGTLTECVSRCLDIFQAAQWGSHLLKSLENSQAFFKFDPKNDGFNPVYPADWKALTIKVANDMTSNVLFF